MSCANFIGYTYAHLAGATAITVAGTQVDVIPDKPIPLILTAIALVVAVVIILLMKPSPLKYALFATWVFFFGSVLRPLVEKLLAKGLLIEVLVTVAGIFGGMTLVGFADRQNMLGLGPYLLAGLTGLIVVQFILALLVSFGKLKEDDASKGRKPLLWFGLALFTLYVGYDTQVLKRNAKACLGRPDYINESMGLYLDLLNLFTKVGELFSD